VIKRVDLTSYYSPNLNYKSLVIKIPASWGVLLVNNTNSGLITRQRHPFIKAENTNSILNHQTTIHKFLYFYNDTYFFRIPLPMLNYLINIDINTSSIVITTIYVTNYYRLYWYHLKNVFYVFHKPFFMRIKFKGKGYYIFKGKRSTITPQFGHSHRIYLYSYFISVLFLAKTRILIFGFSKLDILSNAQDIRSMRPINIFTGRGVRFNRQIVFRKTGKVSSYR